MCAGMLLALSLAACGPEPENARAPVDLFPETPMQAQVAAMTESEVVELVKEQAAPEGEGTVVEWLQRVLVAPGGQPLFPRWAVQRRAANRFEVRFTYTWIDLANNIESRGYVWQVDGSLRTVIGPEAMEIEESQRARSSFDQQERRALDPEYNLR